jgi:transposase
MLQLAQPSSPAALLMRLKGIGAEFATVLYLEGLFRRFDNRRQLAAYAGLTLSPWKSGVTSNVSARIAWARGVHPFQPYTGRT